MRKGVKYDPTPSNISFVGEKFRRLEKEFNKRNNIDEKSKESRKSRKSK